MSTYQRLFGGVLQHCVKGCGGVRMTPSTTPVVLRPVQARSFLFPANFRFFQSHTKMTKKALVLLADGVEEMEFSTPGKQ